jgi:hypothetical protein
MNPRFIKDVANIEGTGFISLQCYAYEDYHMAIHFMVQVTYYTSLATMYMKEFENLILDCFFKVEYCHLYKYTIFYNLCSISFRALNSMTLQGSYLRVGACYQKTTILPFDSVKQNLLIPNDTVLVKCPQIYHQAIYDL